jgi:hypothetical protein
MMREWRLGVAAVAGLGLLVFGLLVIGSLGEPRAELQYLTVPQVLREGSPADRYGDEELRSAASTPSWTRIARRMTNRPR